MDPALVLAIAVAASLGTFVAGDVMVSLLRWSSNVPTVPRQVKLALATLAMCAASVGALRAPASAVTPPPSVRIVGEPAPDTDPEAVADDDPMADRYVVQRGDSLWRIARAVLSAAGNNPDAAEIGRYWREIYAENRDLIGDNPHLIFPGQDLEIPRR